VGAGKRIAKKNKGIARRELLVGRALILETGDPHIPFLISAREWDPVRTLAGIC